MKEYLGLTGLILCSALSCTDESVEKAKGIGITESTGCTEQDTYRLNLKDVVVSFPKSRESIFPEYLIVEQDIGDAGCKEIYDVQSGSGIFIEGFYDWSENVFYSEKIVQITPEIKRIWPLKEK